MSGKFLLDTNITIALFGKDSSVLDRLQEAESVFVPSVVSPTLLYINSEAVIPAKAGIQLRKIGFRVKPGMTIKVKGLMTHYTRVLLPDSQRPCPYPYLPCLKG